MQLGTTLSPISESNTDVQRLIDYYELPGWLDLEAVKQHPNLNVLLHNLDLDWSLASASAIDESWSLRLSKALHHTDSEWFSLHLGFASERVTFDDHMLPMSEPLSRENILDRFVTNLREAISICPVPLLVENLDYCPEGAYEHICEPEFISAVLDQVDCGLLLDIGHLQVSASWLGITSERYLELLPLDRVVEVHMSSPRPHASDSSRLDDVHEELIERDIELLKFVLGGSNLQAITLEYRRESGKLVEQLNVLRKILE